MIPYIPGGQEALAEGIKENVDTLNTQKFKMALLSSQISQESQARMAETAQVHKLNDLTGTQLGGLGAALGIPADKAAKLSSLFPEGVPDSVAQGLMAAQGASNRAAAMMNKPVHYATKPDANNLIQNGFMSPATGTWISQPQTTLDPHYQQELGKVDTQVANAKNMIQGIGQRAQKVLANAPTGVPLQELDSWFQSHGMPTNPDLKAFNDSLGSLSAQYIKDTTGMAPRSMELMKMDMGAFPNSSDDAQTAMQKIDILNQTMGNKAASAHQIMDPTNNLGSSLHPLAQGAAAANKGGDPLSNFQGLAAQEIQRRKMLRSATNGPK